MFDKEVYLSQDKHFSQANVDINLKNPVSAST